jgi:hypothetical protein
MFWNGDCKIDGCEREAVDSRGFCKKHLALDTETPTPREQETGFGGPIPLNEKHKELIDEWSRERKDLGDLWGNQECRRINLETFARSILAASQPDAKDTESPWNKTEERPPKRKDGYGKYKDVLALYVSPVEDEPNHIVCLEYGKVARSDRYPYWMPIPSLPAASKEKD